MSEDTVKNRVAVVTGAGRGIGRGIAEALARDGLHVICVSKSESSCGAAADAIRQAGGQADALSVDVSSGEQIRQACEQLLEKHECVDILVNNAGITRDGTLHKMSYDDWSEVMRINLGGCFNMAKACFPGMRERGWGRIVNIGSINGQAGQYGQVNYAAAKSGIHGFTKALAQEGAKFGITVNAIAPGYIDTDMVAAVPEPVLEKIVAKIPVGRLGEAKEIARGVAFLCSEDAGFLTGSTMSINGGQHMY